MIPDAAPEQWQFAVVRVTGPYAFNVARGVADCGHLLPGELLVEPIDRHDPRVSEALRGDPEPYPLWRIDGLAATSRRSSEAENTGESGSGERGSPLLTQARQRPSFALVNRTPAPQEWPALSKSA